jgi:hypothetical protein
LQFLLSRHIPSMIAFTPQGCNRYKRSG